jgi:hypothetical protein
VTDLDRPTVLTLAVVFALGAVLAAFMGARPARALPQCLCGHDARAHEHNRPGTWCALCPRFGELACVHYVPTSRPSWADDPPVFPGEDGDELAAEFLRKLAIASRMSPVTAS